MGVGAGVGVGADFGGDAGVGGVWFVSGVDDAPVVFASADSKLMNIPTEIKEMLKTFVEFGTTA